MPIVGSVTCDVTKGGDYRGGCQNTGFGQPTLRLVANRSTLQAERYRLDMPKVGKTHYAYTPKGMAQAKAAAKKKGMKVQYSKKKTNG